MDKLTAIIVDDEANGRRVLTELIQDHCPDVELLGAADSAAVARTMVAEQQPDVVFLDIMMPVESGFDFLERYEDRPFSVIFVTAYHDHAIRAIKASAVDYLLKPVDIVELREGLQKVRDIHNEGGEASLRENFDGKAHTQIFYDNLKSEGSFSKIILQRPRGIKVVNLDQLIYIRSDAHYTTVRTANEGDIIVTGTLKEYEEILTRVHFCRIHKSHLINLEHVAAYSYTTAGRACLSNGEKLIVSKRRTREFMSKLQTYVGLVGRAPSKK